ncbi:nuclear protein 96-domain-containing protein [Chaetomium sp. MPI-CAGE-AT-0009]|nr:nuclear protein 96-domain-containing protein [Chaetomium sp. MPI-CAGE-AT-0009]
MSFGFGSGGFGQNTQNQSSTFGGFGTNNTSTNTGFGAPSGTTGFGSGANTGTTGTGMFGGGGSTGGGFGTNTTSAFGGAGSFGSKPAFGTPATTSAGGGLFGSGTTTTTAGGTGFGGFGGSNTTTSTPFGGGSTSLFGSAKPATTSFGTGTSTFGTGSNTGGGLFGSGTGAGTTGFGATTNPGIGANIGDPPGTAIVAFSPTVEKEPNNPAQSNSFQNLLFMDAYKKWSADELRLTDYNQGRKTGGTGGTGAFGGSNFGGGTTGFGTNTSSTGFGTNTGTGMFGNTQPAATGFGATNSTTTGGFGTGGGGLFGNKPATGGLFGTSTTTQPAQTGGIFGGGGTGAFGSGSATTNTGFGANTGTTGGGLFGNTNTTASKPGGFSFGNTGASTGGGAFGGTTATPGFGANTTATNTGGGGLFGNTQTNTTGGGLFGNQQQQPQQAAGTGFGGGTGFGAQTQNTGGGLFGNQQQQQKPGGLFGSSTTNTGTTGGLFGSGNTGTTSAFGGTTAAQPAAGGGLFGNKPAGTSGGLFGSNTTAQTGTTGGGLFGNLGGNTQTQQPAQGGLFGGLGQGSQAKPSLFGNSAPAGGGLFGNQPAQQQQGGLFGASTNQQQPQQGMLGNSLLGGSQGQQMPQQAFNASIHDISAYGAATLFSGLPDDKIQNPGPLATPLSGASKVKSRSILPMYKLSPANASRLATPQKRGYGFSYSAYGSPASPSSVSSTPGGFSQSLLVGSVNRSLGKSISASNLRRSFNVEDSILQPGAFSANSRLLGGASNHKKLVINKEMRSDLFTSPNKEKQVPEDATGSRKLAKRVSFDTSTVEATPESRPAALENGSSNDDQDQLKPSTTTRPSTNGVNGAKSSPSTSAPEMEQVKGNELAIVPEEASPVAVRTEKKLGSTIEPGGYWMSPSVEEIRAMNRVQRQRIPDFTVGRENVGSVTFKIPVDLSNINLDELFDGIVVLVPRSATVYPVAAKKPPVGKGLNVPAVISLEHSYPRGGLSTTGRRLERHIERLKTAIPDTTFESYDKETGVWTFSVEHFTTYGLGDDDDDDDDDETEIESIQARRPIVSPSVVKDSTSPSDPDDTFEFRRSRRAVPGAFDEAALSDNEEVSDAAQRQGTLSPEPQEADAPLPSREWPEDESMADGPDDYQLEAYEQSSQQGSVEGPDDLSRYGDNEAQVPAGIMRARLRAFKKSTAPTRIEVAGGDDWTQILQASVRAPRTVDRATLRAQNESGAAWDIKDRGSPVPQRNAPAPDGAGFATSIDLMKSLFEQAKGPAQPVQASPTKGFVKWPYQQRPKVDSEEGPSVPRTNWGPNERLVTTHHGEPSLQPVDGSLSAADSSAGSPETLARLQHYIDNISGKEGQPIAGPEFRELAQGDSSWELASLLFDDNGYGLPVFWRQLVSAATDRALTQEPGLEEKAIICLAGNRVGDACGHLLAAGNFRLATLVSSIGTQNKDMKAQLKDWRESNVLAEFSKPIRAIYELLAGNASVCSGVKNAPIENRVDSFTISQHFGLDWMRSFGLRLFYTTGAAPNVAEAVRSFQADIEQDKEPEPDSALWSLLKAFANQDFDWSDTRLGWLMTKAIYATGKVSFGQDAAEKLDMASLSFASSLTVHSHWVPATFVLLQLSDAGSREAAVRDHLGRHAHRIGSPRNPTSAFSALRKFGVPEAWIWEAKALDFRTRGDSQQEFLALVWAQNYAEANQAFVHRVGPDLVIERDFNRLFRFAQLLFKVKGKLQDWDRAAAVYLLYPMARVQNRQQGLDKFDHQLFDGLVALRGQTHGDIRQEAAIGDMAEELIRCRGGDPRLFGLLPGDVRGKYMRTQALENIC